MCVFLVFVVRSERFIYFDCCEVVGGQQCWLVLFEEEVLLLLVVYLGSITCRDSYYSRCC
jgi:hypothetical protein